MSDVKVEIKDLGKGKGRVLTIELPVNEEMTVSESGKTLSVASTRGNKETSIKINGKSLYVGVNAYIYAAEKEKAANNGKERE